MLTKMLKIAILLLCGSVIFVSGSENTDPTKVSNAATISHDTPVKTSTFTNVVTAANNLSGSTPAGTSEHNVAVTSNIGTAAAVAAGLGNGKRAQKLEGTSAPPDTTTPASTTTTASTTTPETTSIETTTIKTTTTSKTTTTTTTTTTPAPPSTTTAVPNPETGKWMVKENNDTCIIVQMAAQFNISYTPAASNETVFKVFDIPALPRTTNATGKCGTTEQILTISWMSSGRLNDNFTLHFVKNETTKKYSLHHFEVSFPADEFPNFNLSKSITLVHNASQFSTGLSNSYRCFRSQRFNLTSNGTDIIAGNVTISSLQFQAFKSGNSTVFDLAKDCAFDTPDFVPIAVGCTLAGLVVIVLIAYLVGRKRSQNRGYVSM